MITVACRWRTMISTTLICWGTVVSALCFWKKDRQKHIHICACSRETCLAVKQRERKRESKCLHQWDSCLKKSVGAHVFTMMCVPQYVYVCKQACLYAYVTNTHKSTTHRTHRTHRTHTHTHIQIPCLFLRWVNFIYSFICKKIIVHVQKLQALCSDSSSGFSYLWLYVCMYVLEHDPMIDRSTSLNSVPSPGAMASP